MKTGIIGYGNIGKVILEKILESKAIEQSNFYVSERAYERIKDLNTVYPKLNICKNNIDAARQVDILFVCVKASEVKTVLSEIIDSLKSHCHIISLNVSIQLEQLEKICPDRKISRIVPSVTAEVNRSQTLICHNNFVSDDDKTTIKHLLESFGTVIEIPETETGISVELTSCMPGFIGAIFKVINDEAERHTSMDRSQIKRMIVESMYGTSKLLLEKDMTFENLMDMVATKGGITEGGIEIILAKFPEIINEMFLKTFERGRIITEATKADFL